MADPVNDTLAPAAPEGTPAPVQADPRVDALSEPVGVEQVLAKLTAEAPPAPATAPVPETPVITPSRKLAGKYDNQEELERGYLELQGKFSQVTADRSRVPEPAPRTDPRNMAAQYTTDQLETFKEGHLMKLTEYQIAQQPEKAAEAAAAIRLIDGELRDRAVRGITQQYEQKDAYQALKSQVAPILEPHMADLTADTPLRRSAEGIYNQMVKMGYPQGEVTSTAASVMALAQAGKFSQGVAQAARQEVTRNIQTQLQQAVQTGAGASVEATPSGMPDFAKMTDRQFVEWKAKNVPNWAQ